MKTQLLTLFICFILTQSEIKKDMTTNLFNNFEQKFQEWDQPSKTITHGNLIEGKNNSVNGLFNKVKGHHNYVLGSINEIQGNHNTNLGSHNGIIGNHNWIVGSGHKIRANGIRMFGPNTDSEFKVSHNPLSFI